MSDTLSRSLDLVSGSWRTEAGSGSGGKLGFDVVRGLTTPRYELRRYIFSRAKMPNVHRSHQAHNSTAFLNNHAGSFTGVLGGRPRINERLSARIRHIVIDAL